MEELEALKPAPCRPTQPPAFPQEPPAQGALQLLTPLISTLCQGHTVQEPSTGFWDAFSNCFCPVLLNSMIFHGMAHHQSPPCQECLRTLIYQSSLSCPPLFSLQQGLSHRTPRGEHTHHPPHPTSLQPLRTLTLVTARNQPQISCHLDPHRACP